MSATAEPLAPLGPPALGVQVDGLDDGQGTITAPTHLSGPVGFLQGGLCAGVLLDAARLVDPHGAPPTRISVRLAAPTPLDRTLDVAVARNEAASYDVALSLDGTDLVAGRLELQGHALSAPAADLASLRTAPVPEPIDTHAFPQCWVCGDANPVGLHLLPGWSAEGRIVVPWIPRDDLGDDRGHVDPSVVCAVLDCPTAFVNAHLLEAAGYPIQLLAQFTVTFFKDLAVGTPTRCVAVSDGADGRKLRGRSAILDPDGVVYATSDALWVAVDAFPA